MTDAPRCTVPSQMILQTSVASVGVTSNNDLSQLRRQAPTTGSRTPAMQDMRWVWVAARLVP